MPEVIEFAAAIEQRQVKVGSQVNYVLPEDSKNPGEIRPAIVVRVWSQTCVNLQVFIDGENDYAHATSPIWLTSIVYSEDPQPRTWHMA